MLAGGCAKPSQDTFNQNSKSENTLSGEIDAKIITPSTKENSNVGVGKNDWRLYQQAIQARDIKICSGIFSLGIRQECQDGVNLNKAIESGNYNVCAQIVNASTVKKCEEAVVYKNVVQTGAVNDCSLIKNESARLDCEDVSFLTAANNQRDLEKCGKIQNKQMKSDCRDQILLFHALNDKNKKYDCASIKNDVIRKSCEQD